MSDLNDYVTAKEAAEIAEMPYYYVWIYLQRGAMPEAELRVGSTPLWKRTTIEEWHATRRRRSVSKSGEEA